MGGLAIGLGLTLIHLVSIPISNTSVNPARSTSQAVLTAVFGSDGEGAGASASAPVEQLWLFWVAPIVGAIIAGVLHRALLDTDDVLD
jgi:aquaporin Z